MVNEHIRKVYNFTDHKENAIKITMRYSTQPE